LSVLDLRLGTALFDIHFWRDGGETRFDVLRGDPGAVQSRPFGARLEFPRSM
jgi:hypothetical protein